MIFTENSFWHTGSSVSRQSSMAGKSGGNANAAGGGDFLSNISKAAERVDLMMRAYKETGFSAQHQTCRNLQGMWEKSTGDHENIGRMINNATKENGELSREALMQILAEHREEILKKLKSGDTGVRIPIGSMCLTEEEWEKLLESFDKVQEEIQEAASEKSGKDLPEERPDTTINGNTVLAPEDTGHDLKSLEELIGEAGIHGGSGEEAEEEIEKETDDRLDLFGETEGSD